MRLFIIRHAKAESGLNKKDFDRNLASKGIEQCKVLKGKISTFNMEQVDVVYSAAARTTQTFEGIRDSLNINKVTKEQQLYNASLNQLLKYIWSYENPSKELMIIGHNPGVSELCSYFLDENVYFSTAQCAVIDFEQDRCEEFSKGLGYKVSIL